MEMLKKIWPHPFKIAAKDAKAMVVQIIVWFVASALVGIVLGLLTFIPVIGMLLSTISSLFGLYSTVAIVLCILKYFDIVK